MIRIKNNLQTEFDEYSFLLQFILNYRLYREYYSLQQGDILWVEKVEVKLLP